MLASGPGNSPILWSLIGTWFERFLVLPTSTAPALEGAFEACSLSLCCHVVPPSVRMAMGGSSWNFGTERLEGEENLCRSVPSSLERYLGCESPKGIKNSPGVLFGFYATFRCNVRFRSAATSYNSGGAVSSYVYLLVYVCIQRRSECEHSHGYKHMSACKTI